MVRDLIIPWALGDGELGDDVLEVGPGFGATTDVFRERVGRLTVGRDRPGARRRSARPGWPDTNVSGHRGRRHRRCRSTTTGSPAARASRCSTTCPAAELQDRLFAEVARVLRPGALFVACDSLGSDELRDFHDGDTYEPGRPGDGSPARLEAAGFTAVDVETNDYGWAARARATG